MKKGYFVYLEPGFKSEIDVFLAKIGPVVEYSFSRYVELALRVLNSIVAAGRIPDDLGYILDGDTALELRRLIEAREVVEA